MFQHYFIAVWRNMAANRLQSAIAIFELALGIATALLMALIILIRDLLHRDHPVATSDNLAPYGFTGADSR